MTFDKSQEYIEHHSESGPVEYTQNGVRFNAQYEPIDPVSKEVQKPKPVEPSTAGTIPEGFKKGRFGRLEPIA